MRRLLAFLLLLPVPAAASTVELAAGGGIATRRFFWVDAVTPNLRGYRVQAFPVLTASADLTALADPAFGDLGIAGSLTSSVGLRSRASGGEPLGTVFRRYEVGPRLRLSPWGEGATRLTLVTAWGGTQFEIDGPAGSGFPSFSYAYARLGGEVRAPLGPVSLVAGGAYLPVVSSGELAGRFRAQVARGVDGSLGAALSIGAAVEARALFSYAHFAHAMEPLPGQDHVAGGALDQYLGAGVQLVITP